MVSLNSKRFDSADETRTPDKTKIEIVDLGDGVAGSEFQVFAKAIQSGGVVRAIDAGAHELPRSALDELTDQAKGLGAKGLVWAYVEDGGGWRSPIV